MKGKKLFRQAMAGLPDMKKQTAAVLGGIRGVALPCALLLAAVYLMESACEAFGWGADALIGLMMTLIIAPAASGMITYAAGASWEGRRITVMDAYHLARIRIREILITGLAAGALLLIAGWLASMVYALIGIVPALLGRIPLVGNLIEAAAAAVIWLISLAIEFAAHAALAAGMTVLTADGVSGRAQAERTIGILSAGGMRALYDLAAVFVMWIVVCGAYEMLMWIALVPGMLAGDLLRGALTAASMTAVAVIYLRERDKQDGMRYHA